MATTTARNPVQPVTSLLPTAARYLPESRELEIEFGSHFKGRWSVDSLQMIHRGRDAWEPLPTPTDAELAEVLLWESGDVV